MILVYLVTKAIKAIEGAHFDIMILGSASLCVI